jgi:hypothetical protein
MDDNEEKLNSFVVALNTLMIQWEEEAEYAEEMGDDDVADARKKMCEELREQMKLHELE